jgi:excisionase family DNA binding protein
MPDINLNENFYSVDEIAAKFKVDEELVRRWLQSNRLSGIKIGKEWRVAESDLLKFIER